MKNDLKETIKKRIAELKKELNELEKQQEEEKKHLEDCWSAEFGPDYKSRFERLGDNPNNWYDKTQKLNLRQWIRD